MLTAAELADKILEVLQLLEHWRQLAVAGDVFFEFLRRWLLGLLAWREGLQFHRHVRHHVLRRRRAPAKGRYRNVKNLLQET